MDLKTIDLSERAIAYLKSQLPVKDSGRIFDIEDIIFVPPTDLDNVSKQLEMRYSKKGSLKGEIRGKIVIRDEQTGDVISKSPRRVSLVPIYALTDRGTYMVNGVDKSIRSSMKKKSGIYTRYEKNSPIVKSEVYFDNKSSVGGYMPRISMSYDPSKVSFKVSVASKSEKNFDGIGFLRALGIPDNEIARAIGNDVISDSLFTVNKGDVSVEQIYEAFTGSSAKGTTNQTIADLWEFLAGASFGGSDTTKDTIGIKSDNMNKEVFLASVKKMFNVIRTVEEPDNRDDLRFKDILDDNDLFIEELAKDVAIMKQDAISKLKKENIQYTDMYKSLNLNNSIDKFIGGQSNQLTGKTSLVHNPQETNPLYMASIEKQISQSGGAEGFTSNSKRNAVSERNLKGMGLNRLDPVETPESDNIGLVERVTQDAIIKNKTIYAPVLRVFNNKTVNYTDANTVELTPGEEYDSKVAYFDPAFVKRDGNKLIFSKDVVPGRYKGKNVMLPLSEVKYVDKAAQNIFSYSANLIPYVNHDDGNRALMGTNMQRDALVLTNREKPLVSTSVNGSGETYEKMIGEKYGKPVRSSVDGTIKSISDTEITVTGSDGKPYVYQYYKYFKTNESHINNELKVKVGDTVKKGQIIAEGWQTKDGELALGVNARVGYMTYDGYNYEDGFVISRSFSNKTAIDDVVEEEVRISDTEIGGTGSKAKDMAKKLGLTTRASIFSKLDQDGIIKRGESIKPGDTIGVKLRPRARATSGVAAVLGDVKVSDYVLVQEYVPENSYTEGVVERITSVPNPESGVKEKFIITIIASKSMKVGDKISGKHGNKGTITKILDDEMMPVASDGKPLDVILSPLGIPSRKNVGQVLEVGAGLVAEKTGKRIIVNNFDKSESDKVKKGLAEIGVPDGKMIVTLKRQAADGTIIDVPTENPVTVGNMYMMRLNKNVDDKIQARSNIEGKSPSSVTFMPSKEVSTRAGEKHNPQSMGEMEFRALQAHGAAYNILESTTIKADGGGDRETRAAIFNALKTGNLSELDMAATPGTLKVVADTLKGFQLNLKPSNKGKFVNSFDQAFDSLSLVPIKGSEFIKMVGKENEVKVSIPMRAKSDMIDVPLPGGIVDPAIFGEKGTLESRNNWGYIKLAIPMPNPVLFADESYNPYSTLTGVKASNLKSLMSGKSVMIMDPEKSDSAMLNGPDKSVKIANYKAKMVAAGLKPGDFIAPSKLAELEKIHGDILWKAGGESIQFMLDQIDVNKELKVTKKLLDNAKGKDINKYYKKFKMLDTLKKNKMEAADLMMEYVPVTPIYMRQISVVGKGEISNPDINTLYNELIKRNNPTSLAAPNGYDMVADTTAENAAKYNRNLFQSLENVVGTNNFKDIKREREYTGLVGKLGTKKGLIRNSLLKKRLDFSGRAVIGVDPNLTLNEVGIPLDMAKQVYKPFVIKELLSRGYASNFEEAMSKINQGDSHVKKVLDEIAKDRPVLLNRQPSLHEQSVMAMRPIIKETQDGDIVRNIQLNPLVVTAYNADFDGDQMAVHVPITDKANEEAKKIMMPTSSMISNTNGSMIFQVRQEMVMGIYYLTRNADKPEGKTINYNSYQSLKNDWKQGKISTYQSVSSGVFKDVTAGYILFAGLVPAKYRIVPKGTPWTDKDLNRMFTAMNDDCEASNGKDISKMKIAEIMDNLKTLGFDAGTKSGLSIGLNDFKKIDDVDKLYNEALDEVNSKGVDKYVAPTVLAGKIVGDKLTALLGSGKALAEDNPVNIIMQSGARGKPDQYRKIMGSVGIGADISGKYTEPVKSSFVDGLSPSEYWTLSADSRKGIYDRSVATAAPGAFTRDIWSTTQDMIITEHDCGTGDNISLASNSPSLIGRTAAVDVVSKTGQILVKKNQMVTKQAYNKIYKDESIPDVKVRSPLRCKTVKGVCQLCYGSSPGTQKYPSIGTAIGVIASQSFGEPFTQGALNTFHSGGAASFATQGLPRVRQILNLSSDEGGTAVLVQSSGKITKIEKGMLGTFDTVCVNNKEYKIPHFNGMSLPLRVKVGDLVSKGDYLTVEDSDDVASLGISTPQADPREYFKLRTQEVGSSVARTETQDMILRNMSSAIGGALGKDRIDQRHMEVVLSKMTSKVVVVDGGDSNFIKGETIDKNVADNWNKDNSNPYARSTVSIGDKGNIVNKISGDTYKNKKGMVIVNKGEIITESIYGNLAREMIMNIRVKNKPVVYEDLLLSKETASTAGSGNFFSSMGISDVRSNIARGATMGDIDPLSDPRGRMMTGKLLNLGSAAQVPRNIADSISSKIRNIFSKN